MPKRSPHLVAKKIRNSKGILTTVYVKIAGDSKLRKKKKLHTLMRKYRYIIGNLNRDIREGGELSKPALGIKLMMYLGIRVGNEASAQGYVSLATKKMTKTYGLTTLTKKHVDVSGDRVKINFIGKKGVEQHLEINNKALAEQVKEAHKEAGETLLGVDYNDIKRYIYNEIGKEFSPKDFRGLRANLEAVRKIKSINKTPPPKTKTEANAEVKEITNHVSQVLGNTIGVAKRSYIDDNILKEHLYRRFKPKRKRSKS